MEKQRNQSSLKDEENFPERMNNEADLFALIDTEFRKEAMKILQELWKAIDRSADYCKKELESIWRGQEELENSLPETQAELKGVNSRMDDAEERISGLEGRIMWIIQSEQQLESQVKKKKESDIRDRPMR